FYVVDGMYQRTDSGEIDPEMVGLRELSNAFPHLGWFNGQIQPLPRGGLANFGGVTGNRQGHLVIVVATDPTSSPVPSPIGPGLSGLRYLTSFDLRGVGASGDVSQISEVATMTQLTRLRLDVNNLSGRLSDVIPTVGGSALPNIGYLNLGFNN